MRHAAWSRSVSVSLSGVASGGREPAQGRFASVAGLFRGLGFPDAAGRDDAASGDGRDEHGSHDRTADDDGGTGDAVGLGRDVGDGLESVAHAFRTRGHEG